MSEALAADWDPPKHARELVRDVVTGQLGYIVRRAGRKMVRLDNPAMEILRPYSEAAWAPEATARPMSRIHAARVAFDADRSLCGALGMHERSRVEWGKLTDAERHGWIAGGPKAPALRVELYKRIMDVLKEWNR